MMDSVQVGGHSSRVQSRRHRIKLDLKSQKEDISLELVTVGRGWAFFQLA